MHDCMHARMHGCMVGMPSTTVTCMMTSEQRTTLTKATSLRQARSCCGTSQRHQMAPAPKAHPTSSLAPVVSCNPYGQDTVVRLQLACVYGLVPCNQYGQDTVGCLRATAWLHLGHCFLLDRVYVRPPTTLHRSPGCSESLIRGLLFVTPCQSLYAGVRLINSTLVLKRPRLPPNCTHLGQ